MNSNQTTQWNQFVVERNGSFLQSWQWGEFQRALGRKIWRIERGQVKGLLIKHNLPLRRNYLYCPRGPLGEFPGEQNNFQMFLEEVKKTAKQERSIFLKIEPLRSFSGLSADFGFVKSPKKIQPAKTLILDLVQSEEELLSQMHQKTRYNIRLAQRKGVVVEIPNPEQILSNFQTFYQLLKETAQRDKFYLHPREYYQKILEVLGREEMVRLYLAEYQGKVISGILVVFFGQTATYLHGASDYNFRQLMAPYLLQWRAIYQAKELGFRYYDLYGIDEQRWPGLTRFKKGFGGREVVYPGASDLIFRPIWYKVYNLARGIL